MTSRQLRLVRAAGVSSVATLIAAVSHTLGGGAAPHPLLILAVSTLITPLCAVLVGRRQSRVRITGAVFFSQAVFHLLFQAMGSPTGAASNGGAGHSHHLELPALAAATPVAAVDASMLFAHAVAAALTALLIWHGEKIARAVATWFQALLLHAAPCAPADHRRPVPLRSVLLPTLDAAVSAASSRRGPPVLVCG